MVRIVQYIIRLIAFILPWLFKIIWAAIMFMATTIAALWSGIPGSVEAIADEWLKDYSVAGYPSRYDVYLHIAADALALIVIFIGWVLLSYLTVFIIWWIF